MQRLDAVHAETCDHGERRAAPSTTDITGTPPRRIGTSILPQDSSAESLPPQPSEATATHSTEVNQRCGTQ
ncbi:hypothetical protein E2C01_030977 [Portunus trituberculatus]|uniref:Uncharacterized protein n=1 Tax=Portunus trituberculatus TaxID=210409 RepID=A0A5B7EWD4_PORTR|nr:hypothetical protein [Portunus trituberculatus]